LRAALLTTHDEDKIAVISRTHFAACAAAVSFVSLFIAFGFRPAIVLVVAPLLQDFSLKYFSHFLVTHHHLDRHEGAVEGLLLECRSGCGHCIAVAFYLVALWKTKIYNYCEKRALGQLRKIWEEL